MGKLLSVLLGIFTELTLKVSYHIRCTFVRTTAKVLAYAYSIPLNKVLFFSTKVIDTFHSPQKKTTKEKHCGYQSEMP